VNLYAYVGNAPSTFIDPFGLTPEDRVNWAKNQLENNTEGWKGDAECNKFVAYAHIYGDPDAGDYPRVWRGLLRGYRSPLVSELADPYFESAWLDNFAIDNARPGDIIVWYGHGGMVHHSAIYIGNNEVIYQHADEGVKQNTVEAVNKQFSVKPIMRRYMYPPN
jgi:hypothetical protein